MSWLNSILIALLSAAVGCLAAGFVAAGYVDWYHVTSREGASGYFIAFIGLGGGLIGLATGLVVSRHVGGFLSALGFSTGGLLAAAGVAALLAWGLADIPPKIDGHELNMIVEVRLPQNAAQPSVVPEKQFVVFESGSGLREFGALDVAKATLVDGRWVVPGHVRIASTRAPRSLTVVLNPERGIGFDLQAVPGHPGPKYRQWSGWIDYPAISYRFRIEEIIPEPPVVAADPFNALTEDSPLEDWLRFFDGFARIPERHAAILAEVARHPADFAKLLRSLDYETYGKAMDAAAQLPTVDPAVLQAMRAVGGDILARTKRLEDPGATAMRFNRWSAPWEHVCALTGEKGAVLVAEIRESAAKSNDPDMQRIAADAQVLLGYFNSAPQR